jgi:hypothetical protein
MTLSIMTLSIAIIKCDIQNNGACAVMQNAIYAE